jgi:flagellar hook-basal body protein
MPTVFPPPPSGSGAYTTPLIQKIIASDRADNNNFGESVSISADGNTAIIGAPYEDTSPNSNNGAAYIFTRSGSTWSQQAKLLASDAASNEVFGTSVSLSASGNTALIGVNQEDTSPYTNNGAAYVFTRSGTTWTQQAKLLASEPTTSDFFGISGLLSLDGNTAIIGAFQEDTFPNTDNGAAYVFTRSGTTWTEQQKLLASDAASTDRFGWSVSISGDGIVSAMNPADGTITVLGQLTLADFVNPAGLAPKGNSLYAQTDTSGAPIEGIAGTDAFGSLQQGMIEASNVQLVNAMVDLITAQRAYEANSKSLTTTDSMLQQVNQLKR